MRKLLIISMIMLGVLGFSYRRKSKPSPPPVNTSNNCINYGTGTVICTPRCKDINVRDKALEDFKNHLISSGYTIVRSITSDTTFDILVKDKYGIEHWEHKQWCSL